MFCSGCGNQLRDGAVFCDKCGKAIGRKPQAPNNYASEVRNPAPITQKQPFVVNIEQPVIEGINIMEDIKQKKTKNLSINFSFIELICSAALALFAVFMTLSCCIHKMHPSYILIPSVIATITASVFTFIKYVKKDREYIEELKNGIIALSLVSVSAIFCFIFLTIEYSYKNGFLPMVIAGLLNITAYICMRRSKENKKGSLLGIGLALSSQILNLVPLVAAVRIMFNKGSFLTVALAFYVLTYAAFSVAAILPLALDLFRNRFYASGYSGLFVKAGSIGGIVSAGAVLIGVIVLLCCTTFIGFIFFDRDRTEIYITNLGYEDDETFFEVYASSKDFSRLTKLEELELWDVRLTDELMDDIGKCKNLKKLKIRNFRQCTHVDCSGLSNLENLEQLYIGYADITNTNFLSNMPNLKYLYFYGCNISSVSCLENCTKLENLCLCYSLAVSDSNLYNLDGLKKLKNLRKLCINNHNISDISPIENLTSLEYLSIKSKTLEDLSPIYKLNNLKELTFINENTPLDFNEMNGFDNLTTLSMYAYTRNLSVIDIPNLEHLYFSGGRVYEDTIAEIHKRLPDCKVHDEGRAGGFVCCTNPPYYVW